MNISKLLSYRNMFALFAIAFFIQSAHHAEHVTQMIQIFMLGMPAKQATGLLGARFNFEWVHFTYCLAPRLYTTSSWNSLTMVGGKGIRCHVTQCTMRTVRIVFNAPVIQ